jgi:hypothetical protein
MDGCKKPAFNPANQLPPLFFIADPHSWKQNVAWIVKQPRAEGQSHAVFEAVGFVVGWIPFKFHSQITM